MESLSRKTHLAAYVCVCKQTFVSIHEHMHTHNDMKLFLLLKSLHCLPVPVRVKARFSQWFIRSSVGWPWHTASAPLLPRSACSSHAGLLTVLQIHQTRYHLRAYAISKNSSVWNVLLPNTMQHTSSLPLGFCLNVPFMVRPSLTPLFRIVIPISIITHPHPPSLPYFSSLHFLQFTYFTHLFYLLYFIKR